MLDVFDTITLEKPKDIFDTLSIEPKGDIFDFIEEQVQVPEGFEVDFTIDPTDPIFKISQKAREIDTGIVRDFLGLTEPEEPSLQPFDPSEPPGVRRAIKPRDILMAAKDEDIDFIQQTIINDPLAVPGSVGKLVDREQKIRQEMKELSQESSRTQNVVFALGNFGNLFNVNAYLDRQGLNPFSKGQYEITLEAVNRLIAQRPLSAKNLLLEFGVHAPKVLLEFAALPDVGSKIKMLEKTPRLRQILLTGLKFATREAVQAPGVEETLAERSEKVLGGFAFGAAVGTAGEFIPSTVIRAPVTIGGAGLLTLAQGGSKEDVIKTMATIAGFEALGLIKRASKATDARIRRRLENKAVKAIRKQGEVRGLDLSKVPEESLREIVKSQKQVVFWQRQRQKGKITKSVLDKRLGEQVDRMRPILEAIARQQPPEPTARPPVAPPVAEVPAKPIVPPKPAQAKPKAKAPTEPTVTAPKAPVAKPPAAEKGKVMRLYHGGAKGIKEIKPEYGSKDDIVGAYFTDEAEYAKYFAEKHAPAGEGEVRQYDVTLKNPANDKIATKIENELRDEGYKTPELWEHVTQELKDQGYDSVVRETGAGREVIVFDKASIKPAEAVEKIEEKIPEVEVETKPGLAKSLETIRKEGQQEADTTIVMPKNLENEDQFHKFVEQFPKAKSVGFPPVKAQKAIAQRIKKFAQGVPEFKLNPTFTFDKKSGQLVFKDRYRFAFYPEHFGLDAEQLKDGQTVRFDLESFGIKQPTKAALRKAEPFLGEPKILGRVTKKPTPLPREILAEKKRALEGKPRKAPKKPTKAYEVYYNALVDIETGKKTAVPGGITISQVTEKDIERAARLGKKAGQGAESVELSILSAQERGIKEQTVDIGKAIKIIRSVFAEEPKPEKIQQIKNKAQATGKTQTVIKKGKEVDVVPDEDVSIVDDPGTLGAAETIPEIDASLRPKGKPVSARDVIFQMERDFGVPFRSKVTHIFRKKIAHFQIKSKVIRSIDVRNLSTATHELGHHLDHNFFGNIRKHPPPGATEELLELGKALYGKRKPPGGYKSEGVAEYMRLWLTDNDAENRAPNFTKWFNKYLKDNPNVAKRLNRTRKLIEKWKAQGAVARIESQIVTGKVRGSIKEQLEDGVRILETLTLDRFAPLRRLRDEIGANQFKPSEDPFVVATANATKSGAKAAFFALEGTTDLAGNITGISLQEALAPVSRNIKNWETWAVAARARHLHHLGINPGISKTDADFVFEQFKSPEFEKALDEFTKWNHRGLDYMVEAGALEKSVADRIKKRHPVYVPFKRAFKEGEVQQKFVPNRGFVETGSPIKKIKGSGRAVKDPIQEAMTGMEAMISTAQKAQVANAMAKLADRFPGIGKHIVRIPAPKVPTTFSAEQIKGDILKIAVQRLGIDPTEINIAQVIDTWDEDLTVFTKGFKFTGKENVISIVRGDRRLFYEVSPDLFKTLKGLDKFTLPWYLDFWMGKANRALKLGATGINPAFALRNFVRDLQTFGFTTEFARGNFLAGVAGIGKDIATDFSDIAEKFGVKIPKSQDVLKFQALGGELATFILQDKSGVKHLKSTVLASDGTKFVINTFLHPIHVMRELVGITEVGTRIGEFGPALREGERRFGKGTADATMFALNAAQDVTVNFSRMGTLFQILNQVIPFSNVAVQGPAKILRTMRKHPFRSIRRGMIGLLIPAVWLWWRNKDKKWWKSLPTHEKGNYLHFENPFDPNEIFRFPIAFELGHIFQSIPIVVLDAMYQDDPSDVGDMFRFVLEQANPLDWPAAVGPIIDAKENKDFAGRPIVPRSVEGRLPEDRFTPQSTALMKFIGRKLKMSPAQLDFLASTYSGGVYGRTARLLSLTNEPPETKSDLPIIGTLFLRDPFAPRKEIEEFYNKLELLSQKNQSKKITKEEHREFIIRGRVARAISPQWKLLRDAKIVKQRKVIYGKIENAIMKGDKAISRLE